MKIFVLPANENWICDNIVSDWKKHNPDIITNNPYKSDIIWLLSSWLWKTTIPLHLLMSKKVVATIHHIDNNKFDLKGFMERDSIVDAYHVYDKLTEDKVRMLVKDKPIHRVIHWYDPYKYHPLNKETCRREFGFDGNTYVIGSFQRDTEGHDLITPKLSKGPDIFCDYVKSVNDWLVGFNKKLHVLLGGYRRQYVIRRLEEMGITYTYKEMADLSTLREMYNALDLYVVSSRTEGGPQAVIECAAMKVPIFSTNVGIASDILSKPCINNVESFVKYTPLDNIMAKCCVDDNYDNVKQYDINNHKYKYIEMFESIIGKS